MEYDTATAKEIPSSPAPPGQNAGLTNGSAGRGRLRVAGNAIDIAPLTAPLTFAFSGRTASNRFLKAPMTERLCHWDNEDITKRGVPSPELVQLYKRWGEGNIGIIVSGNLMVSYSAVEGYGNPIFCDNHDNRLAQYQSLAAAAKAHGSLFIAQISHPGRQGGKALNPHPVSASDVQLTIKWAGNEFAKPRPLSVPEIRAMVQSWGETAYWCHRAGFDGVQVHSAHGYLLAQFLSRTTNHRTDEYGGSLDNRSRILFEVIEEIRRRVPDPAFIICVKINSVEFQNGGTTPDDCKQLCIKLEEAHVDFVDLSGGTFEARAFDHKKESTKAREAYFIEFAEMIQPHLKKTKVYVTGGFRTASGMVDALKSGACDGVGIGRPLSAEPYLCKEILEGKITGALGNLVPLPLNTQASGTQLHQIGAGEEMVSDWSVEEEVKRWIEANEKETQRKMKILPLVDSSGFAPLRPLHGFSFLN